MTSQKSYKNKNVNTSSFLTQRGSILVDILLALSIATLFVFVITETFDIAQKMFYGAQVRNYFLDIYTNNLSLFTNMMPYEEKYIYIPSNNSKIGNFVGTTTIKAQAKWYGNERIETIISISNKSFGVVGPNSVVFSEIRNFPREDRNLVSGNPVCAVDFGDTNTIGSYKYLSYLFDNNDNYSGIKSLSNIFGSTTVLVLPVNPLLPMTDIEVRGDVAYLSSDSSTVSDPDFMLVDMSDRTSPTILSSINTGPGISAFKLIGNRVFAAAASTAFQLHIMRLDSLSSIVLEKKFQLPLPYATSTPPTASAIYYYDNKIYLGTTKWDGEEFSIIDVGNPISPVKIGGFDIGSKVEDIVVINNLAYIASSGQKQMIVLDVSDPQNIRMVDYFGPSGWERQEGKVLSYFEGSLYLGRTSGGFDIPGDHELFSWSNASTSVSNIKNDLNTISSINLSGGVYGILPQRSNIITATRKGNNEIMIFKSQLSSSTASSYSLPVLPQNITCFGNKIYILAHGAAAIYEVIGN